MEKEKAREKAKAKESTPCEGTQGQVSPPLTLGSYKVGTTSKQAMVENNRLTPTTHYLGPRQNIQNWRTLGADNVLQRAIMQGAKLPLLNIPNKKQPHPTEHASELTTTIGEYLENGAIRHLTPLEVERTKYWVPVFGRHKKDNNKIRIITDLRDLNICHQVPKHKAETWNSVLETLSNKELKWGQTLDLKIFFHLLQMHKTLQRWMRFCIWDTEKGNKQHYQIQAMPFGWGASPWWANKLTKPIRAWLNNRQWEHAWWVDDILILGRTPQEATE
jgi:hypothetical protein